MDIRIIIRLDTLISREMTGSPKKLASKLAISERSVYNYISFMKKELRAPIAYNYQNQTYMYSEEWEFKLNNK
jgi:transcriptional antiterminator